MTRSWLRALLSGSILLVTVMSGGCIQGGNGNWPLTVTRRMPAASTIRPSFDGLLTVATYNIHLGRQVAELREDLRAVDADVWLLQEVMLESVESTDDPLRAILPEADWHVAIVPVNPAQSGQAAVESQAIASRFPITRTQVWPLAGKSQRRRCALVAWIDVGGREIVIVNTDHEPGFWSWDVTQDAQLDDLIEHLSQLSPGAVIAGGDFNTCGSFWRLRTSTADARNAAERMRSAAFVPVIERAVSTFSAPFAMCLDQIYLRGLSASSAVVHNSSGSDHRAVYCTINLGEQ